jgi:D-alanyl-D-alanine carboxypeptidase (penicillin-binding protein 5/6)
MRTSKTLFVCAGFLILLSLILPVVGYTKPKKAQPPSKPTKTQAAPKKAQVPADPNVLTVEAKGAVLADVASGTRLFEYNPDVLIEPASFTKVLTLYLVFEALQRGQIHLQDEVYINESAWRTGGSKMFVGIGTKVPLEELIKGIAVLSGNDACVALAEHIDGSAGAFVADMNRKAQELGMVHSAFLNPHGLPADGQITSAGDMTLLAVAYLKRFPEALQYHSMQEYTYNGITQYNRNHLLRKDSTVDGLKTGFVEASGYHLAATANRDGMRLVAVVMGAARPSVREREAAKMLSYGYRRYTMVNPFKPDQPVTTVKLWRGIKDELPLFAAEPCNVLVLQSAKNSVKWTVEAPQELSAPIVAYQPVGKINFSVGETSSRSVALVSHEDVAEAGWFKRIWQTFLQFRTWNWKYIGAGMAVIVFIPVVVLLVASVQKNRSRTRKRHRVKRF